MFWHQKGLGYGVTESSPSARETRRALIRSSGASGVARMVPRNYAVAYFTSADARCMPMASYEEYL